MVVDRLMGRINRESVSVVIDQAIKNAIYMLSCAAFLPDFRKRYIDETFFHHIFMLTFHRRQILKYGF